MSSKKSVIIIGYDPSVVDYSKWPGLTPEKLVAGLEGDLSRMRELGYDAEVLYIDLGTTAESAITKKLTHTRFDCVLIGAGVRTSVEHFLNFEKVVNIVHKYAPSARICFNTNPFDSTAAFQRWV